MLTELTAYFEDNLVGRTADRLYCKRAEQERHGAADHQADEDCRAIDLNADRAEMGSIDE